MKDASFFGRGEAIDVMKSAIDEVYSHNTSSFRIILSATVGELPTIEVTYEACAKRDSFFHPATTD